MGLELGPEILFHAFEDNCGCEALNKAARIPIRICVPHPLTGSVYRIRLPHLFPESAYRICPLCLSARPPPGRVVVRTLCAAVCPDRSPAAPRPGSGVCPDRSPAAPRPGSASDALRRQSVRSAPRPGSVSDAPRVRGDPAEDECPNRPPDRNVICCKRNVICDF